MTSLTTPSNIDYSLALQGIVNLTSNRVIAHEVLLRNIFGKSIHDFTKEPRLFVQHGIELCQCIAEFQRELTLSGTVNMMFVNFSPEQISGELFVRSLDMFYLNGIIPSSLAIEITEQNFPSNSASFYANIEIARVHGHPIIVDDFGAGISNFNQVALVRPSVVKTDRKLISKAENSGYARRCLRALINYIHDIGAKVVVEGIESEKQRDIAEELGANFGQGYYFGVPEIYNQQLNDLLGIPTPKAVVQANLGPSSDKVA